LIQQVGCMQREYRAGIHIDPRVAVEWIGPIWRVDQS
jgi:hypothetical protein